MVVEALAGFGSSFLELRYKLPRQGAEIEIEARAHWNEKDRMLKLSLPFTNPGARLLGQVAYGAEALPANGDEVVAQKWLALVPRDSGPALTVINDRTYGADCLDGELRLTLLRSPAYAAHPIHDRPVLPEDRYSPRQDQGEGCSASGWKAARRRSGWRQSTGRRWRATSARWRCRSSPTAAASCPAPRSR
jgi:alpha-mannosidase